MIPRRYYLHARPLAPNNTMTSLAAEFNKNPDGFFFHRSAHNRAVFYTHQLGLPLKFTVLHRDDLPPP